MAANELTNRRPHSTSPASSPSRFSRSEKDGLSLDTFTDPKSEQKRSPKDPSWTSPSPATLRAHFARDPRFNPPPPSPWKRVALLLFFVLVTWAALRMRMNVSKAKDVLYAERYSKEHKFRPAASPVVTEVLKDGRTKLRGAHPTAAP